MSKLQKTLLFTFLIAGFTMILCCADVVAQGRGFGGRGGGFGGPGGLGGPGFGRRGGGGMQGLLRRDDVRSELDLTDEQLEELESIQQGFGFDRERMREMREEMEGLSDEERRERFMELRQEREAEVKTKLENILLPFQFERLQQISAQATARTGSNSLIEGPIAEKLNITDKQKDKIRERAEKLQREFNERVEKMRKEMQEEILEELSSKQRKEFEEMMGESFKFEEQERGDRGDRGGRRGRRGQRSERDDFDVAP